jgi:hypothetical protein
MEQLKLPVGIVNKGDVMRLQRELNALNDFFVGASARKTGTPMQLPKTTRRCCTSVSPANRHPNP